MGRAEGRVFVDCDSSKGVTSSPLSGGGWGAAAPLGSPVFPTLIASFSPLLGTRGFL